MNLRKDHYRDSVRTRRRRRSSTSSSSLRVRFLIAASNDRDSVASRKDAQYDFVDLCVRGTCPDGLSTISSVGESLLDFIGDGSKNVRRRLVGGGGGGGGGLGSGSGIRWQVVVVVCRLDDLAYCCYCYCAVAAVAAAAVGRRRVRPSPRTHGVFFFKTLLYRRYIA